MKDINTTDAQAAARAMLAEHERLMEAVRAQRRLEQDEARRRKLQLLRPRGGA